MTPLEQLALWLKGEDVHNDERDECCPDFSCCDEKNRWPQEIREEFAEAYRAGDEDTALSMLVSGLSQRVATEFGDKVYVSGQPETLH